MATLNGRTEMSNRGLWPKSSKVKAGKTSVVTAGGAAVEL